ncbi:Oidioi.mRNA.OKI2018_I69.PAR.g9923.t1.cds [Oikopleura dioica]|uniref:Oidioi.mRNA.OKI2018_I69.PAR.g9923.t1.cds n=1 Tax=Oikopleura dioica TaxID=34765 RepID=A0ABN7RS14_OIKDI|nr:Oidioi.mRNA.OKI2018_I69.PAR.g9923.t1.cds [Oikopleura dioica]
MKIVKAICFFASIAFGYYKEESSELEKRSAENDAKAAKLQSMMLQLLQMPKRTMSPSSAFMSAYMKRDQLPYELLNDE